MLDPWIIEKVRQREEREHSEERRRLELPLERPHIERPKPQTDEPAERGTVIIDI